LSRRRVWSDDKRVGEGARGSREEEERDGMRGSRDEAIGSGGSRDDRSGERDAVGPRLGGLTRSEEDAAVAAKEWWW
jgi:hypothetical protein